MNKSKQPWTSSQNRSTSLLVPRLARNEREAPRSFRSASLKTNSRLTTLTAGETPAVPSKELEQSKV